MHLILGHELVGKVVAVGGEVGHVAVGDTVTAMVRRPCRGCPTCRLGRPDMCLSGQYREYGIRGLHGFARPLLTLPGDAVLVLDPSLGVHGVLVEPLSVVEKAVELAEAGRRRLGLVDPERWRALVIGCGAIGLLTVALLRFRGHAVTVVDRRATDAAAARIAGAVGARYVEVVSPDAFDDLPADFDVAFEASGDAAVALAAHGHLAAGGVQVQIGVAAGPELLTIDAGRRVQLDVAAQLQVVGTANASAEHFARATKDLPALLALDGFARIITGVHDVADFPRALWPQDGIKTVVSFGDAA
jgi:threonine dehydrogenase-like Zn-dependent dehydrogenase